MAKSDPTLYHRMTAPRPQAECGTAMEAFWDDVRAAREKHQIAEVMIVAQCYMEEGPYTVQGMLGAQVHAEPLAAQALGYFQSERQKYVASLLTQTTIKQGPKGD